MKTQRELAAKRRLKKLALVQEQVEQGMLVREMTPEERAAEPPRPPGEKPRRRWSPLSP